MKRKLITYDAFDKLQCESLSSAQSELIKAEPFLAQAIGVEDLQLKSFGAEDVVYETNQGSFVHANFDMQDGQLFFDNVEELVIDEETEQKHGREVLSNLVDAILEGEDKKADNLFDSYLDLGNYKRSISEAKVYRRVEIRDADGKGTGKYEKRKWDDHPKSSESGADTRKRVIGKKKSAKKRSEGQKSLRNSRRDRIKIPKMKGMTNKMKHMAETAVLCNQVMDYLDYKTLGPVLSETHVAKDDRGNVTAVKLPNTRLRLEAQMKQLKYNTTSSKENVLRHQAHMMAEDLNFCKACDELRRQNNMADNAALEETLENIVSHWPNVLYLTQTELSEAIRDALETVGASNFDDNTCTFMAEGILRTAHDAYVDRVAQILRHAGVDKIEESEDTDKYLEFQKVVSKFYPTIDESAKREMQVYVDLYEAVRDIYGIAEANGDQSAVIEASGHLEGLQSVITMETEPTLGIAESAAEWLAMIVETNLETGAWNVSNSTHVTVSGDHPRMAQNARQKYAPSADLSGKFGDAAPVSSDGNWKMGQGGSGAKEMRSRSWGNISKESYPTLQNPYVPKPFGDYKIKGEKHVDADSNVLGHWQAGGDTWPDLQNPYVPKGETPSSHKMKDGSETDLVVDK